MMSRASVWGLVPWHWLVDEPNPPADDTLPSYVTLDLLVDCDAYTLQVPTLKKNIGLFSGFVSDDDEVESLSFASEEVTVKLIDFLQSPNAMTEVMLAEKEHMDENNHIRIEVGNRQRVNAADNVIEEERESEYDDMQQDGRPNPNKTMRKIGDG
ncbi:hypothetical protein Tco_0951762 [Tanacetum coccineum]|uniref:Uncharacterized protein n=1 Tax=Tanacetum coccineum TaxID=301880 RepID=A0ABQ5DV29_9ASTR